MSLKELVQKYIKRTYSRDHDLFSFALLHPLRAPRPAPQTKLEHIFQKKKKKKEEEEINTFLKNIVAGTYLEFRKSTFNV